MGDTKRLRGFRLWIEDEVEAGVSGPPAEFGVWHLLAILLEIPSNGLAAIIIISSPGDDRPIRGDDLGMTRGDSGVGRVE